MNIEQQPCNCPVCNQEVEPADGLTADERIVRGILTLAREMQDKAKLPNCPRCGQLIMTDRSALSRQFAINVCPECGTDEAMRAATCNELSLNEWWISKEIYELNK